MLLLAVIFGCNPSDTGNETGSAYTIEPRQIVAADPAYYSINMKYPDIVSDSSSVFAPLNTAMQQFLDTATHYYWDTDTAGTRQVIEETGAAGIFELMNAYQVLDSTENLISIKFETYSFALGAHGFTGIHTFNYYIPEKKFLKITDVLDLSDSLKLKRLDSLLVQYFKNPDNCFNQAPEAGRDFTDFGLRPDSMLFFYEPYALGAYYCGMASIGVPAKDLREKGIWKLDEMMVNPQDDAGH